MKTVRPSVRLLRATFHKLFAALFLVLGIITASAQTPLLAPGNQIIGVAAAPGSGTSAIAVAGTTATVNNYPAAENPNNAIDANTATKYLNFAETNTGFIVTIPGGLPTVTGFRFTTANDAPDRDPLTIALEGTSASDPTGAAGGATWTLLYAGDTGLATDPGRFLQGPLVSFTNTTAFRTYRVLVTSVRNGAGANSMQFSEVQLFGGTVPDTEPPVVASKTPGPGMVGALNTIIVTFSEAVQGVTAGDLLINGTPATGVSASSAGDIYTFTFPQAAYGPVAITWAASHGIADLGIPPNSFNPAAPGNTWSYTSVDTAPPVVNSFVPLTNSVVRALNRIEVLFSEDVTGVDASDLLINGVPAAELEFGVPGQFSFTFPQPPTGTVQVAWAANHGIRDRALTPNNFAGGSWTYTLSPGAAFADIRINEFLTDNENGIRDEDGSREDWIELYNGGTTPVDLAGWYLTDNTANLTQWRLPAGVQLAPNAYLFLWASGKDRTNVGALHTNFKLERSGEFLGLVAPDGSNVVSAFTPTYPPQRSDVSFGRDRLDPNLVGSYATPTPNAPNSVGGPSGFTSDVKFSVASSTFVTPFNLTLSTKSTNAVIRYVLITNAALASGSLTNIPTTNSPIYTGAIPISVTTEVRARAFEPGLFPSTPITANYIQINNDVRNFSSDIPIVVVHVLGNNSIAATPTSGILMAFDNERGRSSLANAPQTATRMTTHIRGSSTLNQAKSNLRVELWDEFNQDQDYPLLGFPSDSDWVLLGLNGFDPPLMHNAIYQWLGQQVGVPYMRNRYVEVFRKIDGGPVTTNDYFGLYLLLETPKVSDDRLDIATLNDTDTNAPAITGGYLMKIDRVDTERSFSPPTIGGIRSTPTGIAFVDPPFKTTENDPRRLAQINYFQTYINQFLTNLSSANYTNPVTGYAQYIDPVQWINHLLANIIPFNVDGYRLSGFFYKDRNGRLEQGPMWDCDRCLGTGGTATPQGDNRCFSPRFWRLPATDVATDNGTDFFGLSTVGVSWFTPLFRDPNFWQLFIDRYQYYRQNVYSSNSIVSMVDGFHQTIREAQVREQARWAPSGFTYPRAGSQTVNGYTFDFGPADNFGRGRYIGEVNFQKKWLLDRLEFFDTNFLAMPTLSASTSLVLPGTTVTVAPAAKAGTILLYTLDGTDPRSLGGAISPTARTNDGSFTLTISNNVRLIARSYNTSHANLTNAGNEVGKPLINSFWSGPAVATYYTAIPNLRVTEVMFHPTRLAGNTNGAENYEYIELKNVGSTALDLTGFKFTNGIAFDFSGSAVTNLAPGAYVLVVKNLAAFTARYGARSNIAGEFAGALDDSGEQVALVGRALEPVVDFTYNNSWYRLADGSGFSLVVVDENVSSSALSTNTGWRISRDENGSPGVADGAARAFAAVLVNEALTHTDIPVVDAVELHNPGTNAVAIGGWYLTDDFGTPKKFQIPAGTTIPARGFVVFTETNFNVGANGFSLSSEGDELFLFSAEAGILTGYYHGFDFGAAANGVTFGRYVNSVGAEHFVAQSTNTLGATNARPRVGPVVISEFMYHPPEFHDGFEFVDNAVDEFIELHNITSAAVSLFDGSNPSNTWHLSKGADFVFPRGASIAANGYALLVNFDPADEPAQLAAFAARYSVPAGTPVFGPFGGKLDNSADSIKISRPDAPSGVFVPYIELDQVDYSHASPWPTNADGFGLSLHRILDTAYGNDPTNWIAVRPTPGTGNVVVAPPVITQQPQSVMPVEDSTATLSVTATGAGPLSYQWRFNGGPIHGATGSSLVLSNLRLNQSGVYSVAAFNGGGAVFSLSATVTVRALATITLQPQNLRGGPGTNLTFRVAAVGSGPLSYQWRFNGVAIPGATGTNLALTNIQLNTHAGFYSVAITDSVGTKLSDTATLIVLVRPAITNDPVAVTVVQGASARFTVVAGPEHPLLPLSYRWLRNAQTHIASGGPSVIYTNLQNPTSVRVAVTNLAGSVASATVTVTVLADADGDGTPDEWEMLYGFNTTNSADGLLDSDGDGMNNRDEFTAGTDPRDPLSFLKVERPSVAGSNEVVIVFNSFSNRTYTVQSRDTLGVTSWTDLFYVDAVPTNRVIRVTNNVPGVPSRFYRIAVP